MLFLGRDIPGRTGLVFWFISLSPSAHALDPPLRFPRRAQTRLLAAAAFFSLPFFFFGCFDLVDPWLLFLEGFFFS